MADTTPTLNIESIRSALEELATREAEYRHAHDLHGDDSRESGRAWDLMRRAGDQARTLLSLTKATPSGLSDTENEVGRDPSGQALAVPVEPASGLAPSGFDPSRERPSFDQCAETLAEYIVEGKYQPTYASALQREWGYDEYKLLDEARRLAANDPRRFTDMSHEYKVVAEILEYFDSYKLATWAPVAAIILRERTASGIDARSGETAQPVRSEGREPDGDSRDANTQDASGPSGEGVSDARSVIGWIMDNRDNQDLSHRDFRIEAGKRAEDVGMAAFGASDAACYLYPGEDQAPERAAYCQGAADAAIATPSPKEGERLREAWQPIETAPKDGTRILIWTDTRVGRDVEYVEMVCEGEHFACAQTAAWRETGRGIGWDRELIGEPLFWMPLPGAPAALSASQGVNA